MEAIRQIVSGPIRQVVSGLTSDDLDRMMIQYVHHAQEVNENIAAEAIAYCVCRECATLESLVLKTATGTRAMVTHDELCGSLRVAADIKSFLDDLMAARDGAGDESSD